VAAPSVVVATVYVSERPSDQAVQPRKPMTTTSVISVPMRKDLSVSRVMTSRRATSNHARSVGSLPVVVFWAGVFSTVLTR